MADEHDAGIDKQKLLDEIVGASTVPESPAPPPAPLPAAAETPVAPPAPPPPVLNAAPLEAAIPRPPARPPLNPKAPPPLVEFRNEVAALALGGCGAVWAAVGIATQAWLPGGVGILLLALALVVWVREVLREE